MKVRFFLFLLLFTVIHCAQAQTLFTYGNHAASKEEFLEAFSKNPDTTGGRHEKLKEYLDLYINYRLKLQAAYDEKANENADVKAEAANFKTQLTDNFINQQANINQLLHEAFLRSQKDILLQQVFVQFTSTSDTTDAYKKIVKAYNELKSGKSFDEVAATYSTDSTAKTTKGNVGYITVFTLPYSIENIVYNLKPGNFSAIYKSNAAYHIFKNAGERSSPGRKKIEQLLFPIPSLYTDQQVTAAASLADSVYHLLQTGTLFSSLLPVYGHHYYDYQPANSIEVKVGDYSEDFEQQVFNLKKPGDFSKPFKTKYGFNILKLDENLPVANNENDVSFMAWLQTQIQNDGRLDVAKNNLVEKWLKATGFKQANYNHADLWMYTDSALKSKNIPAYYKQIKPETVLFQFTKKKIIVEDWIEYLRRNKIIFNVNEQHDFKEQMHGYIRIECNKYYREHIEDFDTAAAAQIKEFNEANMLFYVMDKHVWSKASNDTAGLKNYYEAHKNNYVWKESVTALVVSAPDKTTADSVAAALKAGALNWRNIVAGFNNAVYVDSNRFQTDQLPVKQKIEERQDFQTIPEPSAAGDVYTFIHILQYYPQPQQKSFEETKGEVTNDFQQQLEQQWLAALKKIYPVKINIAVLKTLH